MPTEIPDLWGDAIDLDVLPPLTILKAQATAIGRKTKGLLRADVITSTVIDNDSLQEHSLQVFAVALGYRETVLDVVSGVDRVYPASIRMPVYIDWHDGGRETSQFDCETPAEFISALSVALQSRYTQGIIANLIARSNESKFSEL